MKLAEGEALSFRPFAGVQLGMLHGHQSIHLRPFLYSLRLPE